MFQKILSFFRKVGRYTETKETKVIEKDITLNDINEQTLSDIVQKDKDASYIFNIDVSDEAVSKHTFEPFTEIEDKKIIYKYLCLVEINKVANQSNHFLFIDFKFNFKGVDKFIIWTSEEEKIFVYCSINNTPMLWKFSFKQLCVKEIEFELNYNYSGLIFEEIEMNNFKLKYKWDKVLANVHFDRSKIYWCCQVTWDIDLISQMSCEVWKNVFSWNKNTVVESKGFY